MKNIKDTYGFITYKLCNNDAFNQKLDIGRNNRIKNLTKTMQNAYFF